MKTLTTAIVTALTTVAALIGSGFFLVATGLIQINGPQIAIQTGEGDKRIEQHYEPRQVAPSAQPLQTSQIPQTTTTDTIPASSPTVSSPSPSIVITQTNNQNSNHHSNSQTKAQVEFQNQCVCPVPESDEVVAEDDECVEGDCEEEDEPPQSFLNAEFQRNV